MTGQDLITMTNARLGGYQNSVKTEVLMDFINAGKDDLWAVLKDLNDNFFMSSTQNTDATQLNYFPSLDSATREYTLPDDFQELQFIEVLTSGYEDVQFIYKPITHPDFLRARREATADGVSANQGAYLYDIIGKGTFMLASYPETTLYARLWYVKNIPDLEVGDTLDEIILPFSKKIAEYATQKVMLRNQDQAMFEEWKKEWRDAIILVATTADPRQVEPDFVIDFEG